MRDHGAGTVTRRKDGLWQGQVSLGTGPDGKRRRRSVYGKSKREVTMKLKAVRAEFEATGLSVTDRRTVLGDYIGTYTGSTLEARVISGAIKRSTAEWHESMLRTHVAPVLGRKRLEDVAATDVEALMVGLSQRSQSLRRGVYTALSRMMDTAVRDGLVARNPCAQADRPTPGDPSERFLTADEVAALLGAATGTMRVAILLMALTGLRRGELLALRWMDVDLGAGVADINGSLSRTKAQGLVRGPVKSPSSRRAVPLAPVLVDALRPRGLPMAPLFPSAGGGWWEPRNFTRRFGAVALSAGVDCTPHDMRHSVVTSLVAQGVPLPVVADLVGHSDVRITSSVYTHVVEAQKRAATDALAATFGP